MVFPSEASKEAGFTPNENDKHVIKTSDKWSYTWPLNSNCIKGSFLHCRQASCLNSEGKKKQKNYLSLMPWDGLVYSDIKAMACICIILFCSSNPQAVYIEEQRKLDTMKYCNFCSFFTAFEITESLFRASAQSCWLMSKACIYLCIQHCVSEGPTVQRVVLPIQPPVEILLISLLITSRLCLALQTYRNPDNTHCSASFWFLISVTTLCRTEPAGEPTEKKTFRANSYKKWNKMIQASTLPNSSVGMSLIASIFGSCQSSGSVALPVMSGHFYVSKEAWLLLQELVLAYLCCGMGVISRKIWSFFPLSFWKEVASLGEMLSGTQKTLSHTGF